MIFNIRAQHARAQTPARFQSVVRADEAQREDTLSVSTVRPEERGTGDHASVADLLRGEAGVSVRSGGLAQFSGALIRGASPGEVTVLRDGVPLSRGGIGAVDLAQIPVDGLAAVDVYRGVPPVWIDGDALGGAINLITRQASGQPALRVVLSGGSFGTRKAAVAAATQQGGLSVYTNASYQGTNGNFPYYYTNGFIYNVDQHGQSIRNNDRFDQGAADVRIVYRAGATRAELTAHGLLRNQGVAGIGQPGALIGAPDLTFGRAMLTGRLHRTLRRGSVEPVVYLLLEDGRYRQLATLPPELTESLGLQAGGSVVGRVQLHRSVALLGRVDGRYEHQRSTDLCPAPRRDCAQVVPTASQRGRASVALGAEIDLWGRRLQLRPGVQALLARSELRPLSSALPPGPGAADVRDTWFVSPRLGAALSPVPGLTLRASGGRLLRLPTFLELFGDRALYFANLSLRPEAAWIVDGGARYERTLPRLSFSLSADGFVRLVDDFIETVRSGAGLRARNFEHARMAGAELEGALTVASTLAARLHYTFLDARDQSGIAGQDGKLLPSRAPHALFLRLEARYRKTWGLFYELDHSAALFLDAANTAPRPGRTLHTLGAQLGPFSPGAHGPLRARLAIEVRNVADTRIVALPLALTDDRRATYAPLVDYLDFPLPGRAVHAALTLELDPPRRRE